jgi:hypothetical protein
MDERFHYSTVRRKVKSGPDWRRLLPECNAWLACDGTYTPHPTWLAASRKNRLTYRAACVRWCMFRAFVDSGGEVASELFPNGDLYE